MCCNSKYIKPDIPIFAIQQHFPTPFVQIFPKHQKPVKFVRSAVVKCPLTQQKVGKSDTDNQSPGLESGPLVGSQKLLQISATHSTALHFTSHHWTALQCNALHFTAVQHSSPVRCQHWPQLRWHNMNKNCFLYLLGNVLALFVQ